MVFVEKQARTRTGLIGLVVLAVAAALIVMPIQLSSELISRLKLPVIYVVGIAVVVFIVAALMFLVQIPTGSEET